MFLVVDVRTRIYIFCIVFIIGHCMVDIFEDIFARLVFSSKNVFCIFFGCEQRFPNYVLVFFLKRTALILHQCNSFQGGSMSL